MSALQEDFVLSVVIVASAVGDHVADGAVWLPEGLHAREAMLDRLELAIAGVQAANANGDQLARVDSMVEQALEEDAEINGRAPSTPTSTADNEVMRQTRRAARISDR